MTDEIQKPGWPDPPERRAFNSQGLLAIDPKAFGLMFDMFAPPAEPFELRGRAAIVTIDGPLQTAGWFCDTYDRVRARVEAALASSAEVVVLCVSSPGGDVFGCFDTSRALRAAARAAGKPLIGHTQANACSSAYALISAADSISASDSAVLGSIGVIATAVDLTAQNEALGASFAIITSGARKSDGNPNVKLSDDARAAMQTSVDAMAGVFFGLVKEHRGIEPAALEAATFVGAAAKAAGLADTIESFDSLLARIESDGAGAMLRGTQQNARGDSNMPDDDKKPEDKKDEARASLAKAAEGGNARAKKALAAYDEDKDEKAEDPKKDEKAADSDKDEKASAPPFEKKAEDDKKKEEAIAAAASAARLAATSEAGIKIAALEASVRRAIFAARPDLSAEFVKACAAMPIDALEAVVAAAPRAVADASLPARAGVVELGRAPTQGLGGADVDRLPKAQADELSIQMGLVEHKHENTFDQTSNVQSFGVKKAL